jgi:T5orf172 domain.
MTSIYFAKCGDHIKIGIANNVKKRLSGMQTGSAAPITLLASFGGGVHDERKLHERLRAHWVQGEWFRDCPEVRAVMDDSVEAGEVVDPLGARPTKKANKFAAVARALWPTKTSAHLAAIAGVDDRTAKRWLSGEYEPPAVIIAAIIVEITKRE